VRGATGTGTGANVATRAAASWNKIDQNQLRDFQNSMTGAFKASATGSAAGANVRRNGGAGVQAAWLQSNPQRAKYWAGWGAGARNQFRTGANVYYGNNWWNNRGLIGFGIGTGLAARNNYWGYQPWAGNQPYSYWYGTPGWNSFSSWYGWNTPYYYDYGPNGNVVYQGNQVLVNGQNVGTPAMYSQSAADLAAIDLDSVKASPEDWNPLGTFSIVTSEKDQNPTRVIQLAATKDGYISGSMYNSESDKAFTVQGRIDKDTQRAAFTIGENHDLVLETGVYNLTQQEAPVLAHFGPDKTANYVFVRLPQPEDKTQEGNAPQPQDRPAATPTLP